jgi:hypothetical protein
VLSQAWNPTINILKTSDTDSFNNIRQVSHKEGKAEWCRLFIHLTTLNLNHFKVVEAV